MNIKCRVINWKKSDHTLTKAVINNKMIPFEFDVGVNAVQPLEDLLRVDLLLSWSERGRKFSTVAIFFLCRGFDDIYERKKEKIQ